MVPFGDAIHIQKLEAEIKRLRLSLREIAAMGPADEEWDENTLKDAVAVAKRALTPAQ